MTDTKVALAMIIVSPTHRNAEEYARRKGFTRGSYKTVTEWSSLRGVHRDFPIIVLDIPLRFHDSSVLPLLRQRFTNVRYERP